SPGAPTIQILARPRNWFRERLLPFCYHPSTAFDARSRQERRRSVYDWRLSVEIAIVSRKAQGASMAINIDRQALVKLSVGSLWAIVAGVATGVATGTFWVSHQISRIDSAETNIKTLEGQVRDLKATTDLTTCRERNLRQSFGSLLS